MRVLVVTTAGAGHFGPLVPFAGALRNGGHDVVVAAPNSFASAVRRAGFVHRPFPDASAEELKAVFDTLSGVSNDEANAIVVSEVFGRIDARAALPGMRALVEQWRPDLIVRETSEFASYVVAEAVGIPHVQVAIGLASFEERFLPQLEAPLAELGAATGIEGLRSAPRLSLLPESFEDPAATGAETRRFRADPAPSAAEPLPDWWDGDPAPLVYVTFGSVAAGLGLFPHLYREAIGALVDLPVRVLVTLGDAGDEAALGPLPANVHVENWWPQQHVMPHAAAMVGHGGFGTTLLGLASGVPMVVVPLFADQPHNAGRVHATGAGVALQGGPGAMGQLAGALRRILDERSFRMRARALADEIARLPAAPESVPLLERMVG